MILRLFRSAAGSLPASCRLQDFQDVVSHRVDPGADDARRRYGFLDAAEQTLHIVLVGGSGFQQVAPHVLGGGHQDGAAKQSLARVFLFPTLPDLTPILGARPEYAIKWRTKGRGSRQLDLIDKRPSKSSGSTSSGPLLRTLLTRSLTTRGVRTGSGTLSSIPGPSPCHGRSGSASRRTWPTGRSLVPGRERAHVSCVVVVRGCS
jgi:hypothetical protein